MPTLRTTADLQWQGGYNTEIGPNAAQITHLLLAENCVYSLDGAPLKMPGFRNYNATAVTEAGTPQPVLGLVDFWLSTSTTPTQRYVAVIGTRLMKDDGDGVWDELLTGLTVNSIPSFTAWRGLLIISNDSGSLAPRTWDQTTLATLGGSPPNFPWCVEHRRRLWAPSPTNPSTLSFCALDNEADWTGADTGTIDVARADGDIITGVVSHKGELLVFKGPNRGSIWRIAGTTPSTFALAPFLTADNRSPAIPCVSQHSIIRFSDDIAFASPYGIHSLAATQAFGDYKEDYLGAPIRTFWRGLNRDRDAFIQGVNHSANGYAIWNITETGTTHTTCLVADYRFTPPRWSTWPAVDVASLAIMQDAVGVRRLFTGGYNGFVREGDRTARNIANTAYNFRVETPHMWLGEPYRLKSAKKLFTTFNPTGNYALTITAIREDSSSEVLSPNLGGSGAALDSFILDTDVLGSEAWSLVHSNLSGDFRTLQLRFEQGGLNEHAELHGIGLSVTPSDFPES